MTETEKPSWDELRDEAASWLARMDSGSATLQQFEVWRDADTRHAAAFVQVAHGFSTLDRLKPELKLLVPKVKPPRRRQFIFGGIAAVVGAGGAGVFTAARARTTLRTAIGERKRLTIAGGHILLNTDTEIQFRAHEKTTDVWLTKGEVAVDVSGADVACILHAVDRTATIRHGAINARLRGKMLDVAVSAGDCKLNEKSASQAGDRPVSDIVSANQAILVSDTQEVLRPLAAPDADFLAGWQSGEMVFQGQTLETAVAEYNRYLTRKIYIADPSLAAIRLGGRFTTHDPQLFLESLKQGFGVQVNDGGAGTIVLTK